METCFPIADLDYISDDGNEKSSNHAGTNHYYSPQIRENIRRNLSIPHNRYKSDMYSLGLSLLYLISLTDVESISILENESERISELDPKYDKIKPIFHLMLEKNENSRPDFNALSALLNKTDYLDRLHLLSVRLLEHRAPCLVCTDLTMDSDLYLLNSSLICKRCLNLKKICFKV